jgi:hypothetical protein
LFAEHLLPALKARYLVQQPTPGHMPKVLLQAAPNPLWIHLVKPFSTDHSITRVALFQNPADKLE